jgi:putative chitinase
MTPIQLLQTKLNLPADGKIGPMTFNALRRHWNLTGIQLAHFLGQCDHETGGFNLWTENLNYSAQALLRVFPRYYKDELLAIKHQRKPSVIANHVYANRMGNDQPNDGWTYRGRGAIQLTGKSNYRAFADFKKDSSILAIPDQVATVYAFDAALWYFNQTWLWKHTKDLSMDSILKVSKVVNLGSADALGQPNGLQDRIKKTQHYAQFIT